MLLAEAAADVRLQRFLGLAVLFQLRFQLLGRAEVRLELIERRGHVGVGDLHVGRALGEELFDDEFIQDHVIRLAELGRRDGLGGDALRGERGGESFLELVFLDLDPFYRGDGVWKDVRFRRGRGRLAGRGGGSSRSRRGRGRRLGVFRGVGGPRGEGSSAKQESREAGRGSRFHEEDRKTCTARHGWPAVFARGRGLKRDEAPASCDRSLRGCGNLWMPFAYRPCCFLRASISSLVSGRLPPPAGRRRRAPGGLARPRLGGLGLAHLGGLRRAHLLRLGSLTGLTGLSGPGLLRLRGLAGLRSLTGTRLLRLSGFPRLGGLGGVGLLRLGGLPGLGRLGGVGLLRLGGFLDLSRLGRTSLAGFLRLSCARRPSAARRRRLSPAPRRGRHRHLRW